MGKSGVLKHKSGNRLSLKRVKIEEKLLWMAYRNLPTLFRMEPSQTPYGLLFPKIGGLQPYPKLQSLLSQKRVKLRTSNLARTITVTISEKNPIKNFGENGAWAYPGTVQIFGIPPISLIMGKATDFKFCVHIHSFNRNKNPLKIWEKDSVGVSRDCSNFSGTPIISGTGKATNFKFCTHIYSFNQNKNPFLLN